MNATSVKRRLKRLEASRPAGNRLAGKHARDLESTISRRVLEHLSDEELCLVRDIAEAKQQGSFEQSQIPAEQGAALNEAYRAAFDEECRKAGFASAADFSSAVGKDN